MHIDQLHEQAYIRQYRSGAFYGYAAESSASFNSRCSPRTEGTKSEEDVLERRLYSTYQLYPP